jgi:hypothetical protein
MVCVGVLPAFLLIFPGEDSLGGELRGFEGIAIFEHND